MAQTYPNDLGAAVDALIFDCQDPATLATFYAQLLGGAA